MKTAIVILNWNTREFLEKFLPGLLSSIRNIEGAEVVVADNASSDGSLEYVKENHPEVKVIAFDKNHGYTGGYNMAIAQIMKEDSPEYIVLMNSDVEVQNGWLEPLVRKMESTPDCGACAPKIHSWKERNKFEYAGAAGGHIDGFGYPFCRGRILDIVEDDYGQYDHITQKIFWGTGACLMVRSSLFMKLGGFDDRFFAHMEEIDLQWRMQLAGWKIMVEPRSVVYHLGGGTLPVSARKIYLNHRNNLAMLFKCSSPMQRMVVAIVRPFTDMVEALAHLVTLHPHRAWAVVKAWGTFIAWHKPLSAKRKAIKRIKTPQNIYPKSIVVRYLLGRKNFNNMI